ncbi:MAG: hypothetical protein ACRD0U_21160, partial [Acidimicrobiales bacterium]
ANNKIDAYLDQSIDYHVAYDPETGEVTSTATVTLTNRAPADGLPRSVIGFNRRDVTRENPPPPGTNRMLLSLYTPLDLEAARIDGQATAVESGLELGVRVYGFFVDIGPGASVTAQFDLHGFVRIARYDLAVAPQPLAGAQQVTITLEGTPGWRAESVDGGQADPDGTIGARLRQAIDHRLIVRFAPAT